MNALRLSLVALVLAFTGCQCGAPIHGSGVSKTEPRDLAGPYHRVEVGDGLNVQLTDRDPGQVSLTADDNLLAHIETDVTDGVLVIKAKDGEWLDSRTPISVEVSRGGVNELGASGAAHISSSGGVVCDRIAMQVSGAAQIELDSAVGTELVVWASGGSQVRVRDVTAPKADFQVSGGSQIDATTGKLDAVNVALSGGSRVQLGEVASASATLDLSGGSTTKLTASTSVSGKLSGGSEAFIKGNPATRSLETSGGSRVSFAE
ncbi:MAG: DUF2807 domain-containing protein [Archangiaceae bacterium]|nr:DUF2807 domain-containing protein [Archangiaceae bacterium]